MDLVPIELGPFTGGLNTSSDATSLEPNELTEALNVRIGNKGEVERRTGYVEWTSGMSAPAQHLHRWIEKNGTENTIAITLIGEMFVAKNVETYFAAVGVLGYSVLGDPDLYPISFAAGEDALYISTLRQTRMQRWDGQVLEPMNAVYEPTDEDDLATYIRMPVGQHVVYRHGRLYVGHTMTEKSRVWFSNVLNPEAFANEAWIDLDPEDGTSITAMTNYQDELFIFKDNSMWELTGRDPTTYSLRTVDKLRGTVSPKSVCQMRGLLVFFDRDTGIWGYDGQELVLLSEKINQYLLEGQSYEYASVAAAYFGDDRLYVSIPWTEGGTRTFVMNANNGAWSEYDSGFYVGDYFHNDRYQSFPENVGIQIADPKVDDIVGDQYVSNFRTAWVFPLGPGIKARLRRLEMVVDANQGAELSIDVYREMQEEYANINRTFQILYNQVDVPSENTGRSSHMHTVTLDGWGDRLHSMQFKIGLKYLPTQVNRIVAFVTGGEDTRGERR